MDVMVLSGILMVGVLAILLVLGSPIAVSIGLASLAGILPTLDIGASLVTSAQRVFSGVSVFTLLAIPFFILAGNIMNKGGIALRLINLAKIITGPMAGGLAQTNTLANMLFGSIQVWHWAASGHGSIMGPIQAEEGYDPDYSAAANIASAPTGLLIPPSCPYNLFTYFGWYFRCSPLSSRISSGNTLGNWLYGSRLYNSQKEGLCGAGSSSN